MLKFQTVAEKMVKKLGVHFFSAAPCMSFIDHTHMINRPRGKPRETARGEQTHLSCVCIVFFFYVRLRLCGSFA